MKIRFLIVLVLLLFVFVSPVYAQSPTDEITTDFESLPDYFGLGAIVALVVVVMRMLKLPDGWGGYAALVVGIVAYALSKVLPGDSRDTLFEAGNYAAQFLLLILGNQLAHAGAKRAKLDVLWKGKDGQ